MSTKKISKSRISKPKDKTRKTGKVKKLNPKPPIETIDYGVDNLSDNAGEISDESKDKEEIPELTTDVNQSLKERYEYNPVVRTEIVYLTPENRKTSEIMTRFEYTEIISQRAKQIENGGPCYTDVDDLTDPIDMAEKEVRDKKCPLDIIRMISANVAELWHANEMGVNFE